nr:zonadhesin-like [Maniola hyperantus]
MDVCTAQQCGKNEIPTSCIESVCELRNCGDIGKPYSCMRLDKRFCTDGCLCKEGYLRDENGKCIPIAHCPKLCGKNEIPTSCVESVCELRNCSDIGKPYSCIRLDPRFCTNGCLCKEGYLRDENGICVRISQCPKVCGENEIPTSCFEGICERRNCSDLGKPVICVRPRFCTDGCLCEEGYLRDENGKCIPIAQCPNIQCGVNEIFDVCPPQCPGESCGVDPSVILCLPNPQPGDPSCNPGCRCQDNYFRNDAGCCVTRDQCTGEQPIICGPDEIYNSCINGGCDRKNCSQPENTCVPVGEEGCRAGCQCIDGLLRADDGTCIPADQCPVNCFGQNEIRGCGLNCPPQTCESIGREYRCPPQTKECRIECRCKEGFFRNKVGECISKEDCLNCTGPNEYFSCGGACDNVCATLANQSQTNCPIVNVVCNPKCYCEEGYARDSNNTCVLISECPQPVCGENEVYDVCPATCPPRTCDALGRAYKCAAPPVPGDPESKPIICGADEVYDSCVNGGCGRWNCSQPGTLCIDLIEGGCREGCRCKEGLLRTDEGICVPADQCPLNCFGENEIRGCGLNCPPQTCESIGREYRCPPQTKECRIECRCKEGFFRNKIGECISKEDCLNCTGPNEYFSCGGACDNVCATLANQSQANCPIVNIVCNPKCYCEEGYARDSNNTCVLISECPQPICGKNEVFDECPATCPPRTCDALGRAYKCAAPPTPGDPECEPGCRCADGYYRNKQGICVLESECLNCFGQNEMVGCENTCSPQTCESIGKKYNCPLQLAVCRLECRCKKDFLRNKIGQCISKEDCLKCTGPNEYFSCGGACDNVCSTLANQSQANCPIINVVCNPKCYCEEGYARDSNNTCVLISECPQPKPVVCGADEVFDSCVNGGCGRWNCSQPGIICIDLIEGGCREGCRCKNGLLRTDDGICIPAKQCPNSVLACKMFRSFSTIIIFVCVTRTVFALSKHKSHCGQHEVLSSCANRVCDYQKCSEVGEPIECIRMSHRHCKRGCVCRQNYLRADNGTCILASQCPNALKCPKPNEYYDACPPQCPSRTCGVMDNRTACPEPLEVGDPRCPPGSCRCNVGFYRDSDGSCVTWNLCKTCPENETAVSCFQAKCERRDCSDLGQPVACVRIDPMFCTVGCLCQEGFLRNNNGTCIPINQCPEAQCEDNEEFDDCPPACPGEQCGVDPSVVLCLALPDDPTCEPACRCRVGYLRNNNGKCIPRNKCR